MTGGAVLDLSPGASLVLDGREWAVERREPHLGRVQLVAGDGTRRRVSFRFLAASAECRASSRTAASGAGRGRQPKTAGDLDPTRLELARLRMAHLLEVETGFRSGDPVRPGPGEPRPGYHPDTTTVTGRRRAKAAELKAVNPEEARLLGLGSAGYRTLIRWEKDRRRFGLIGCADDRWLRESGGHPSVTPEVSGAPYRMGQQSADAKRVPMSRAGNAFHLFRGVAEPVDRLAPSAGLAGGERHRGALPQPGNLGNRVVAGQG